MSEDDDGLACDCRPAPPALAAWFLRFFHRSRFRRCSAKLEEEEDPRDSL